MIKIGQIYKHNARFYLLSLVTVTPAKTKQTYSDRMVSLIDILTGNRLTDPVNVKHHDDITSEEFASMIGECQMYTWSLVKYPIMICPPRAIGSKIYSLVKVEDL